MRSQTKFSHHVPLQMGEIVIVLLGMHFVVFYNNFANLLTAFTPNKLVVMELALIYRNFSKQFPCSFSHCYLKIKMNCYFTPDLRNFVFIKLALIYFNLEMKVIFGTSDFSSGGR